MGELINEKRCCNSLLHEEENIPLLWTFAFHGKEYWCPAGGKTYGMLGAGKIVPDDQIDLAKALEWKSIGEDYLKAYVLDDEERSDEEKQLVKDWEYKYK